MLQVVSPVFVFYFWYPSTKGTIKLNGKFAKEVVADFMWVLSVLGRWMHIQVLVELSLFRLPKWWQCFDDVKKLNAVAGDDYVRVSSRSVSPGSQNQGILDQTALNIYNCKTTAGRQSTDGMSAMRQSHKNAKVFSVKWPSPAEGAGLSEGPWEKSETGLLLFCRTCSLFVRSLHLHFRKPLKGCSAGERAKRAE